MKKLAPLAIAAAAALGLAACTDADVASKNLSKAADQFELNRRIVFVNGITDEYLLEVEGRCSIKTDGDTNELSVTCKTGEKEYKKHALGLSDNVTYFSEQLDPAEADVFHYRVVFKPETILPDIDLETSK